jgi:hypothetical protein
MTMGYGLPQLNIVSFLLNEAPRRKRRGIGVRTSEMNLGPFRTLLKTSHFKIQFHPFGGCLAAYFAVTIANHASPDFQNFANLTEVTSLSSMNFSQIHSTLVAFDIDF